LLGVVRDATGHALVPSVVYYGKDGIEVGYSAKARHERGEKGVIRLRISVAPGWHLQGPDGLRIEAWIGSDFNSGR
jgi:hypothetical protein